MEGGVAEEGLCLGGWHCTNRVEGGKLPYHLLLGKVPTYTTPRATTPLTTRMIAVPNEPLVGSRIGRCVPLCVTSNPWIRVEE
jgi:hypothetical protein